MSKAPLGGEKTGPNPTDRAKRAKRSVLSEGAGVPIGLARDGANRNDHKLLTETPAAGKLAAGSSRPATPGSTETARS
jgi:hypothetical protein